MARMFNPPHPGRMVAETLEYLGISTREFARHIGVAPSTVTRIIKEKSPITPEMAGCPLKLAISYRSFAAERRDCNNANHFQQSEIAIR